MLPTKSQIIKEFAQRGESWDYEIVDLVLRDRNMLKPYWRNAARFWCAELSGMAIIIETDVRADAPEWDGRVAHKYKISPYGQTLVDTMLQE